MIKGETRVFLVVSLFLILILWAGRAYCPAYQNSAQEQVEIQQEKKEPEKVVGAPQDVKQRTGIWVFFIWMWISILVLVFFLRWKIKEADRLDRLRFFAKEKK